MPHPIAHDEALRAKSIREKLIRWFDAHARDLPWRRSRDPYAVFVSEIMLQQTRVETVIPYFERFVGRFPTVSDLAGAPIDEVLAMWSGLGYYRRARSLHLAAREVTEHHEGRFPSDRASLEALPGIGAYTAGAIASIAFGKQEAIVDGNVARVLSRLFAIDAQLGSKDSIKTLWRLAAVLVLGERPGDLNQALMELGALVCVPEPRCDVCAVRADCAARIEGRERALPIARSKLPPRRVELVALLAVDEGGSVLLAKRSLEGLFGGLWEPPMVERAALDEDRVPRWLAKALAEAEPVGSFEHVLTHRVLSVSVSWTTKLKTASPEVPSGYVEIDHRPITSSLGLSRLARRVVDLAPAPGKGKGTKAPRAIAAKTKKRVVSPRKSG